MKKKKKKIHRNKKLRHLPENDNFYLDTMTSTNSSNDRLVLRQNVEINSNEYFSSDVFFRELNRRPRGLETSLRNHQEICLWVQSYFNDLSWFIERLNGENFHLFIICYDWWCHFPFLQKLSVIAEALFLVRCAVVLLVVNTNREAQKLRLRQHRPFMSIKSFEQTQQVGQVTR